MKNRSTNAARFALTGVALAAACLWGAPAWALGLGRLTVQSALGEPLKAEIDVTSITPEELATLRLRVASPDAYRAAGVDYNSALAVAKLVLQKRPDGRQVLHLSSDRVVLEPFVDVMVEATWATGRLVRDYTLLFDPPALGAARPAPTTAPAIAPAPAPTIARPVAPPAPQAPSAAPAPRPMAAAPVSRPSAPAEVRVRPGDSLSQIATRHQPAGVSLDQMLVSLFRGNPSAFMADNMNRLKAGAVLSVPSADEAAKVDVTEAREVIRAQAADFNAYRQRLAAGTTTTAGAGSARQAQGRVQASVEDRKQAASATPDKLTLSQGGVKASAPEAKLSKETESKDAAARLAELARNVDELKKLQGAAAPAATVAAAPAPAPAAGPAPAPQVAPAPAPEVAPAPAPEVAPAPAPVAASAPTPASAPAPLAVKAPVPQAEPGFLSSLLESPLVLPLAAVLVALIGGLGIYRLRGRMRKPAGETSFLESRLQPDSFFGASGGQRIDTHEAASSAGGSMSSMNYSLSQLDAIGDVDPVAEADVYLAYGRDLQAEEILKEAMRANPDRMAIRIKLLEVYAKRRDAKGFELLATQVFSLTHGSGEDWARAQELGRQFDPENPMYQPGAAPELAVAASGKVIEPLGATTMPHTAKTALPTFVPAADATLSGAPDVDLDLDLGAAHATAPNEHMPAPTLAEAVPAPIPAPIPELPVETDAGLDFDVPDTLPPEETPSTLPGALSVSAPQVSEAGALDFDLGDFGLEKPAAEEPIPAPEATLDFSDFGVAGGDTQPPALDGDPLARKLELAEEFRQIGDLEGARDLLEEVIAKADGVLRNKAQGMLAALG